MKLELPVLNEQGERAGVERLDVEEIGARRYRLAYSPGLVQGVAAGDEIEVDPNEHAGFRTVRHSGNLCIWVFFENAADLQAPATHGLQKQIERLGGRLDGGMKRSLVFTLPVAAGFDAIEALLDKFVEDFPGSIWIYGNVYDANGDPLNWWIDKS